MSPLPSAGCQNNVRTPPRADENPTRAPLGVQNGSLLLHSTVRRVSAARERSRIQMLALAPSMSTAANRPSGETLRFAGDCCGFGWFCCAGSGVLLGSFGACCDGCDGCDGFGAMAPILS